VLQAEAIRQIPLRAPIHLKVKGAELRAPMVFSDSGSVPSAGTPIYQGPPKPLDTAQFNAGRITFRVRIEQAGEYAVSARVLWQDGASNSFWFRVDDSPFVRFGNDGEEKKWIDRPGPVLRLDAGAHAFTFQERESGARIASMTLSAVPAFIAQCCRPKDSLLVSDSVQLLLDPPYLLDDSAVTLRIFLADTGRGGILAGRKPLPFSIKMPGGRQFHKGVCAPGCMALVSLPKGGPAELTITLGDKKARFANFSNRLSKLTDAIAAVQRRSNDPLLREFVRPSLILYRKNVLRGWQHWHLDETGLASLQYADNQFAFAEEMAKKALAGKFNPAACEGVREYAYYSANDSSLCPYTLYLPRGFAKRTAASPAMLYLHGSNGTQWELERNARNTGRSLDSLRLPAIVPFYRGNVDFSDTIQEDLLQLRRMAGQYMNLDTGRMVLSGFSQGGFFTWAMAYTCPAAFRALIPIAGGHPFHTSETYFRKGQPLPPPVKSAVIILHSPEDESVNISMGREMETLSARLNPRFITYAGGHMVPPDIYRTYNEFADKP
jgi:pimeloyl-ACP methyl ester carboxylesterase